MAVVVAVVVVVVVEVVVIVAVVKAVTVVEGNDRGEEVLAESDSGSGTVKADREGTLWQWQY